jgi:hypothetical protein
MTINLAAVVIDAAELEPESAFWRQPERTPLLLATRLTRPARDLVYDLSERHRHP